VDRGAVVSPDVVEEGCHAVDEGRGAIDEGCDDVGKGCNNIDVDHEADNNDGVLGGIILSPLVAFPWLEVS